MSRKTRSPEERQSVKKLLLRLVLVQAIKFVLFQIFAWALRRSVALQEDIERKRYGLEMDRQRIENERRLKDVAYGRVSA